MDPAKSNRRRTFLRSKVARRVFFLFIICTILPLTALALFTSRQFSSEFRRQAGDRLRQSSKSAGMSVMERLTTAESDMFVILEDMSDSPDLALSTVAEKYKSRIDERFAGLSLVNRNGERIEEYGQMPFIPQFTGDSADSLLPGKLVASNYRKPDGTSGVIATMRRPGNDGEVLLAELRPQFLWDPDGLVTAPANLLIADETGTVLFNSDTRPAPVKELLGARKGDSSSGNFQWSNGKDQSIGGYWALVVRYRMKSPWIFVYSENESEVLQPVFRFLKAFFLIVLLSFWIVLWLSMRQIRRTMVPIETLKDAAQKVTDKDLTARVDIRSGDEFEELGRSFNEMTTSLEERLMKISTMNDIGIALSAEHEYLKLLQIIMAGAMRILHADGAIVYIVNSQGRPSLVDLRIESLDLTAGQDRPPSKEFKGELTENDWNLLVAESVCAGATVKMDNVYLSTDPEFSGFLQFETKTGYRTKSLLGVPLRNHDEDIIGFLQLINAKDRSTGKVIPFTPDDQRLLESVASQAGIALTKNKLVEDFRNLFEGLTMLIATAIDEKSQYTGQHCKRVPILTMMLAEAVCATREGSFKDFTFTADELYELKVAALLHDCGKVSTPVHVVDKSKKLETIFDRIQLVETRLEVIRRDKEIELLRMALRSADVANTKEIEEQTDRMMEDFQRQVRNDLEFLRKCIYGVEHMPEEERERVRQLADRYYWRPDGAAEQALLTEEEVYNLTIQKGTLTAEERKEVEKHVVTTLHLLQALPYPKKLRNVPVYAAAHHERPNGSGYPFGLKREQISVQGRIIGIADIYEALTAKDRPYKKGKPISEALQILENKCREGHIDRDLFEVFVREKVYLRYAKDYLDPAQIDQGELTSVP